MDWINIYFEWAFWIEATALGLMAIAELANYAPVISFSSSKGYRLVIIPEKADKRVLQGYLEAIEHTLREHESRIVNIKARMKPLIAAKKDIEALIEKEG